MSAGTTQLPSAPIRTCVGCRGRLPAADLLRVVATDGNLVPDPQRRLPGRGAWLHFELRCLDAAERRRAFGRALRLTDTYDSTKVREYFRTQVGFAPTDRSSESGRSRTRGNARDVRKQVDPS